MFPRFNNDQWSSLFWVACGVIICIASFQYGLGTLQSPSTGFMPFLAGSTIILLSVIGFVASTLGQRKGIRWRRLIPKGAMWQKVWITVAILFAYAFLLTPLGFTLCTALFVGFLLRLGKVHRWPSAVAGGLVTAFITYQIFVVLLKVQFPKGPWGF